MRKDAIERLRVNRDKWVQYRLKHAAENARYYADHPDYAERVKAAARARYNERRAKVKAEKERQLFNLIKINRNGKERTTTTERM